MVLRARAAHESAETNKMAIKTTAQVTDISSKNGTHFTSPVQKNKVDVYDDRTSSPSLTSQDSCTKLTIDKNDASTSCCKEGVALTTFRYSVCFLCGIVFGIMFVKGRVFEPKSIRGQMVFENFIMLKMFLSAVCSGQLVLCLLSVLPLTKDIFKDAVEEFVSCFTDKGILSTIIGAFILGMGITMAGSCPGMVLAQVGSWVPNSIFTFLGCLVGALTYGMVAPHLQRFSKPTKTFKTSRVDEFFNVHYIVVALPMAICLGVVVFVLEYFWDYTKDLETIGRELPPYSNVVSAVAWRPFVAGGIIGLLQLPLVLVVKDTMGGSSGYVTMVSQWVVTERLQTMFPYLAKMRCGVGNWWQVVYVCGAILGAALSSVASDTLATSFGASLPMAFFGGVLMLWGARYASGCTSGHGLSGMGLLAWLSFVAVPAMFAGGIALGFIMKATGALYDLKDTTLQT